MNISNICDISAIGEAALEKLWQYASALLLPKIATTGECKRTLELVLRKADQ